MEQEEEKNIIIEFQRKVLQEANCTAEMLAYLDEIDDDVFREYYCICALDGMTVEVILSILVDTFISKISLTMQPGPKIDSISGA